MSTTGRRVLIVAGEASGDQHAARLVEQVRQHAPDITFSGIAGPAMRALGVEPLYPAERLSIVGLWEAVRHLRALLAIIADLRERMRREPPALLILVDLPEFNLRLAREAKRLGVPVLYYISPQIWAWRQGRVKKIAQRVDHMAVIFPFEVDFYRRAGVPVTFVGHPLLEEPIPHPAREAWCAQHGLEPPRPLVALLPGSRESEIERLLPAMLEAARRLRERLPAVQFVLPRAATLPEAAIRERVAEAGVEVTVTAGESRQAMAVADAVLVASGTATLEVALAGTPMVIIYRVAPLTAWLMRRLLKIEHVGLCNIAAGTRVVPELLQEEATPDRMAAELARYLEEPDHARTTRARLGEVAARLGQRETGDDIASLVLRMLNSPGAQRT